jgi:hypothetical protein
MSNRRKGEENQAPRFRTDRFIHNGEKWYYETREGNTEGPFRTRLEAEAHLDNYIKLLNSGWWNDDTTGLELEPVQNDPQPTQPQDSVSKVWETRRGH